MITFDKLNQYIIISIDVTEITIQGIYDAIRDFEDEIVNLEVPKIGDCYGKQELGGGVLVGLTLLLYNWTVKFTDRPGPAWEVCSIRGGNIVALDGDGNTMFPITPSSFITTNITSSSSATINELGLTDLKFRIESLRRFGQAQGITWFVSPDNGDDNNSGFTPTTPLASFARAHSLASPQDVIMLLPSTLGYNENFVITKSGIHVRGSSYSSPIYTPGGEGICIENATDVSLDNLYVYGGEVGIHVSNCFEITILNCVVDSASGDGSHFETVVGLQLVDLVLFCDGNATVINGCTNVAGERVWGSSGLNGISVIGSVMTVMKDTMMMAATGYGITVDAMSYIANVSGNSSLMGTLGAYHDESGTLSINGEITVGEIKTVVDSTRKIAIATQGIAAAGLK